MIVYRTGAGNGKREKLGREQGDQMRYNPALKRLK